MQPTPAPEVALVTGGASGMGRATALAFAGAGTKVVIADLDADAGPTVADEISAQGGEAYFVRTDVTRPDEVKDMVARTVERYGRLDCAVNNAACPPDRERIVDAEVELFRRVLEVNLVSMLLCLKFEVAQMLEQGGRSSVVNIGSTRSFRGKAGSPAYTAAKHAVIGLTRTAALEYGEAGIRVNAVCPGAIETPMTRRSRDARGESETEMAARLGLLGRLGSPEEVAQATLWLCSPASSLVTGQALVADGGYLTR